MEIFWGFLGFMVLLVLLIAFLAWNNIDADKVVVKSSTIGADGSRHEAIGSRTHLAAGKEAVARAENKDAELVNAVIVMNERSAGQLQNPEYFGVRPK